MRMSMVGCVFRCGGGDALSHYLRCDHLWTILTSCFKLSTVWLDRSPTERIGIENTNLRSLVMVCVAFRVFHAMNGRRKDGVLDFDDPSAECLNALDLARHFISELPYACGVFLRGGCRQTKTPQIGLDDLHHMNELMHPD